MTHKTFQRTTAAVCGALIAGSALGQPPAAWGEQSGRAHERPRFMMYASLPFGDAHAERPSFGLRLESAPLRAASLERIPYIDFRLQGRRSTLMLAGVPALHASDSSDGPFGNSIDSVAGWPTSAKVAAAGVVVLGVACATRVICKKHKNDNGSSGYTPPGTGTGTGN